MKKRLLSILTALALCLSLLPTVALAADPVTGVPYLDENGDEKTCASATKVTSEDTTWTAGWYVVQGTVEIDSRVAVSGYVRLILTDGCTLTVTQDINGGSLTIYGQANGTGKLVVTGSITGGVGSTGGNGGGPGGAGDNGSNGGGVSITGGTVEAGSITGGSGGNGGNGVEFSNGIGGVGGNGGGVSITGGTVMAGSITGGNGGNGGGYYLGSGGTGGNGGGVSITGGTVKATVSITGGSGGSGGSGGTSNDGDSGIGGNGGNGGSVSITGGMVMATGSITGGVGGTGGTGVSSDIYGNRNGANGGNGGVSITGGVVFQGNSGAVYGDQTLTGDLTIPSGASLTIPAGKTLINKGTISIDGGTLTNNGTIINYGTIIGTVSGNEPKVGVTAKYLDENGKEQTAFCDAAITADNIGSYGTLNAGWYVVRGEVTASSGITVTGDVHLILADHCSLTVENGLTAEGDLTIYAQSTGDAQGSVTATGSVDTWSYGILAGRELTITGGSVTATGGDAGTMSYGILAGNITISGGSVEAKGSDAMRSSGICAYEGDGALGYMTITGGSVTATGGNGETMSCGIFTDKNLSISGGTVTATGGTATATGTDAETMSCGIFARRELTITGGTVTATGGTATATGDSAEAVSYGIGAGWELTITGGHVTAQTLAKTATTKAALSKEPNLDDYSGYYWRIDAAESFTASSDTKQYQYDPDDTYVEISNGLTYTITLDPNYEGGESSTVLTGTKGTLTTEDLPVLTRTGYTFAGWFTEAAGGTEVANETVFERNTTIYAHWTAKSSGGGSGGVSTYAITVESAKNGTVTMTPKTASKGTTVTLTVKPDKGYTLETLTVTDKNGNEIELINKGDGKYTFKMPGSKVTVKATFMEDNSMLNFFVDVPADAYYYDAVLWAAENGITGGTDATHFSPNAPCTRAQIVTFLWRAAGCPEPESLTSLSDVPDDAYYAKAVAWALENGITTGTGDGTTFSPDATCTRAQAMTFIYRSEQAQGGMQGEWMFLNPFNDVNLESYYGEAVMWAVANGVTDGTTATTFSPGTDCTRAQIVTFLFRCLGE